MKKSLITFLGCLAMGLPASAVEQRTFTSSDGSKTFEATLTGYNAKEGTVTVRKSRSKLLTFQLSRLSVKDIAYVKENANAVAASNAIRVDFDLWEEKPTTTRSDTERTKTTPAGYTVELRNWSKQNVKNVKVRYTIFHRKDAENGAGSIAQTKGTLSVATLYASSTDPQRTAPVNLVRYSRQKSGGG